MLAHLNIQGALFISSMGRVMGPSAVLAHLNIQGALFILV
jgi:hypothetical protein